MQYEVALGNEPSTRAGQGRHRLHRRGAGGDGAKNRVAVQLWWGREGWLCGWGCGRRSLRVAAAVGSPHPPLSDRRRVLYLTLIRTSHTRTPRWLGRWVGGVD